VSKLFVGNLSYQLTEDELRQTFQPYGEIKDLKLLQTKGFGFVEYESSESAQKALEELNGKELKGRNMRVEMAKPRENRENRDFGNRPRQNRGFRSNSRFQSRTPRSGFSRKD
jgi:RNA recognition motif-containing protein